jgi:ribosome biogenesis GTPase / thiamine phosphate phosphatase
MIEDIALTDWGWGEPFQSAFHARENKKEVPARVVEEQRGAYFVQSASGEYLASISGKMRHQAKRREAFPAVGDWAAIKVRPLEKTATLEALLPRTSKLSRRASGQETDEQLIAANLDTVFVVTSLNRDFNHRRLERYLAMVAESGAKAVVVLSKADLSPDPAQEVRDLQVVAPRIPIIAISVTAGTGLAELEPYLQKSKTIALIGSSGVGKSILINRLIGWDRQKVQEIRERDDRGRHTTTCRRLIALPQGALLIDTPGMRELQLWDAEGVADTFADIQTLVEACRFGNCRHQTDIGCAVQEAIQNGTLVQARYENYLKLGQEAVRLAHQLATDADRKANEKIRLARAAHKREPK